MIRPVRIEVKDRVGWVTIDNPPVNATSASVRAGLLDAVGQVQGLELAVLCCAGKTFVAGGDLAEFDADPVSPHLPDVIDAIEMSNVPFAAFLHGTVFGGGFEIAMGCAYRVARPGTRFGLPEVHLGLIPGAGGTQRAPRLLGWDSAVEMACLGETASAEDLLALGGIDAIVERADAVVEAIRGRPVSPVSKRSIVAPNQDALAGYAERVARFAKGQAAPGHSLQALQWAVEPYAVGRAKERERHLELRASRESKALRHLFFAERAVRKPAAIAGLAPAKLSKVAVVGGGMMGAGIAVACMNAGHSVILIERDDTASEAARSSVEGLLREALDRGKISKADLASRMAQLKISGSVTSAREADIAIEAIYEDLQAKRAVFGSLANEVRPDAILATNTSYLNPDDIFEGIARPERCLGLHFFSPAHIMKLVEVIRTSRVSAEVLASAFAFSAGLRKTPVLAGICDGFIGNRILTSYRRAAEFLLADGALPHEIDAAMRAFGLAMGPFETQDMTGLQIAEASRRRLDASRDPSERYIPIADRLCAAGRYGRKTGAGWYAYSKAGSKPEPDARVEAMIRAYSAEVGITRRAFTSREIQLQLLAVMANEGARIVSEGIAENDAAVDVVKTAGYGFPRWRGGPMHWAETVGPATVGEALSSLEAASPGSWIRAIRYR